MQFESNRFKVSSQDIQKLRSKYCDSCELCEGERLVYINGIAQKCECVHKFNDEYKLIEANIPISLRSASKQDIDPEFLKQNHTYSTRVAEYSKQLAKALDNGFGLYIQGTNGSGKSFFATLILKRAIDEGYSAYFILLKDLINAAFDALGDPDVRNDLEKLITEVDFLVVDELDKVFNDKNDMIKNLLEDLFKRRYYSKKALIVTSNLFKGDIKQVHGDTVAAIFDERLTEITLEGNHRPQILTNLEQEFFNDPQKD